MTYKTVMVGLALDRPNDACLEVAGQLAKRFSAYAIGTAAGEFTPPLYFTAGEAAQSVLDEGQAAVRIGSRKSKRSSARRCRAVLWPWNGAAPRIFRPDLPSGKREQPTSLS
jgi:hypothetical protein